MGVFSPPTSTMLRLKWVSLGVALLLLVQWSTPNVDAAGDNMFGEDVVQQQQRRGSCDPQRLSSCRDYLERRREQPSERCCNELERMSPQCRCPAIQQVFDQSSEDLSMVDSHSQNAAGNQRRREERGREEAEEEMVERAQRLPNTCNVRQPPRHCDIQRHSRYSIIGSSF
uniref:2S seed storage protein n=1 Tax=Pseudotsuga menziesii TaxID=3357 RepID=O64931_PSEMZ|nr:2S seed storage protein precursor [Pseudotsuga menziesii]